ncbi:hemolysin family protein [Litchfieldia alkalitelluris]|uniref:hemolysin family protein n=1 Tax=Litchfieldia alkalitelluris TaxID=304268 RepID=UPI000995E0B2|nr:hemolysin family protein [Litchfieldia alkalitelluris]
MDSIPYDSIILLGALLILSGYFSATETALTSASRLRLRALAESNNSKAKRSLKMTENFDQTLSTILIGNNIVNVGMATVSTQIAMDLFGSEASTVFATTIVITIMILTFGEILPKSLANQWAERYLLSVSASLLIIMKLFYPVTWLFVKLKLIVNKMIGSKGEEPTVTDEDVKTLLDIGEEEGTFLTTEKELMYNAMEFNDVVVKDILTPRPDVVAVSLSMTNEEIKEVFIQEKYSRMPIYENNIDKIVGVISHRDFFEQYVQNQLFDINSIIRLPLFIIPTLKISTLLKEFQEQQIHLAIVLDEYGGTSGVVTMEDVIEEIVGDIWDEHDDNEVLIEKLDDDKYRVDGKLPIEDFSEKFNMLTLEYESSTISGWITEIFGYLPKKGETIHFESLNILIEEVTNRRIQKVVIKNNTNMNQSA